MNEIIKLAHENPELRAFLLRKGSHVENKVITITTNMGQRDVQALVLENWAVHKSFKGSGWAVTHVPTGLVAMKALTQQKGLGVLEVISRTPALLRADTKAEVMRFADVLLPLRDQLSGKKPVIDIEGILQEEGLRHLGERSGKAGSFWGIEGSSRMIAVGARDVLLNVFFIGINRPEQMNRPDTRWNMYKAEYKTKLTEETLRKWAAWAKRGYSTRELREVARQQAVEHGRASVDGSRKVPGVA